MDPRIQEWAEQLGDDLPWESVGEIEDFPADSFDELGEQVSKNRLALGLNFTLANRLALQGLHGGGFAFGMATLSYVPHLTSIALIIASFVLSNWLLLIGIPFVFVGDFFGNPYNPVGMGGVILLAAVVAGIGWFLDESVLTIMPVLFLVGYAAKQLLYGWNRSRLAEVALSSEAVFLHLYHAGMLGVEDHSTGRTYLRTEQHVGI